MGKQFRIPPSKTNREKAEDSKHISSKHSKRLARGEPVTVNVSGIDEGKELEAEFPAGRFVS